MDTQALAQQAEDDLHECEESELATDDEDVGDDEPCTPIKPHGKPQLPSNSDHEVGQDEAPEAAEKLALEADEKLKNPEQRDADKDIYELHAVYC